MTTQKTENPKFSETISSFLTMMDNAVLDYEWNKAEITRMDQLTQDYLHKLELDLENMTRSQRATLSNQLAQCRRDRR